MHRYRRHSRGSGRLAYGMCGGAADINRVHGLLGRHVFVIPVDRVDLVTTGCGAVQPGVSVFGCRSQNRDDAVIIAIYIRRSARRNGINLHPQLL